MWKGTSKERPSERGHTLESKPAAGLCGLEHRCTSQPVLLVPLDSPASPLHRAVSLPSTAQCPHWLANPLGPFYFAHTEAQRRQLHGRQRSVFESLQVAATARHPVAGPHTTCHPPIHPTFAQPLHSTCPLAPTRPHTHTPSPTHLHARAVLKKPDFVFARTAPRDRQPPTANRKPPPTANRRQPQTATNRQPPTHEVESVPVNIRFCWRNKVLFLLPLRTAQG